jgi:quercetin dioxygenase-like cupin family protein
MNEIIDKDKSSYFDFKKSTNSDAFNFSMHTGWSGLVVIKFKLEKDQDLTSDFIRLKFSEIYNKEKILVVVKGILKISLKKKYFLLKEFDALNFFSDEYKIECKEDTVAYLVSAKNSTVYDKDSIFFNFKNDIEPKDLWGGQCISRIYAGENLNLVMFDLKPEFKFNDKGHSNEQITWVIEGEMDFYANKIEKKLNQFNAVDIGKNHEHGGVSNGALGFDAFYPKREEKKYNQNI